MAGKQPPARGRYRAPRSDVVSSLPNPASRRPRAARRLAHNSIAREQDRMEPKARETLTVATAGADEPPWDV